MTRLPRQKVKRCADVTWEMRGRGAGLPDHRASLGDLLWDPKMGEGHVLIAEVLCGDRKHTGMPADCSCGGWGQRPCPSTTLVCECGTDGSMRDHHWQILAATRGV